MQVTDNAKQLIKDTMKSECEDLLLHLKNNKITLVDYCKINNLKYKMIQQRFSRCGIWVKKRSYFNQRKEPKLNIGICRKASTINAFKELSVSCTGKSAGVILSEYVDRCLREGRVI